LTWSLFSRPGVVFDLEHMGVPFNRTDDGKIDQRPFGGHTRNFGEAPVRRACYAADRTGAMILHTLYQQCLRAGVEFYDEVFVTDLLFDGETRLRLLAAPDGANACENFFECTRVCPRGILVTRRINEIKSMLAAGGYVKGDKADG